MENSKIKRVTIKKLWGVKNISTDFYNTVNIFIGSNGSNKTTFLSLIEAVLLCDITTFINIEFDSITIDFTSSSVQRLDVYRKLLDEDNLYVTYCFDDGTRYDIPCNESLLRPYRSYSKHREALVTVQNKLQSIVNISWLSINRDNFSPMDYDRREFIERFRNMVDWKLEELKKELILFKLHLESEINQQTNKFKENVLSLMLYNADFDVYSDKIIQRLESTDIEQMQDDLFRAFNNLDVASSKRKLVKDHIQKIKEVIIKITNKQRIQRNDVFVLSLINRTLSIIDISNQHEIKTEEIYAPFERFWACLKSFMPDKEFMLDTNEQKNIAVVLKEEHKDLDISFTSLSSGEKQLFILLTEALLQKEIPYLFIADEPELSLHIEWQRKILEALLNLNPNAQIIVATHSPEIAGRFPDNIINMKNIISYE